MEPSCQVATKLPIQNQTLHLMTKIFFVPTKLEMILNVLKIKHLWNEIQIQMKIQYKIHCKPKFLLFLIRLLNKHKTHLYKWNKNSLKFSFRSKVKLVMNVQDCTIKNKSELQINYNKNKYWNAITCYNIWVKPTLWLQMINIFWKLLEWYTQHQKITITTSC